MAIVNDDGPGGVFTWIYTFQESRANNIALAFAEMYRDEFYRKVSEGVLVDGLGGKRQFVNTKIKNYLAEVEGAYELRKAQEAVVVPVLTDGEQ